MFSYAPALATTASNSLELRCQNGDLGARYFGQALVMVMKVLRNDYILRSSVCLQSC